MAKQKINLILFNLFRSFAPTLFNAIIAVLGVKYCGSDNWGELVSVLIVLFVFNFISGWGNQTYLVRQYSKNPSNVFEIFLSSLFTRSILLVPALFIFLYYPLNISLLALGLIVVQYIYNSFQSLIIYHQQFKAQLIAEFTGFTIILFAIFYQESFSVPFFISIYLLSFTLKTILLTITLKPIKVKQIVWYDRNYFKLAFPFFLIGLSGWMHSKVDLYIVNFYLKPSDLSHYQILLMAFTMLQSISALVIHPFSKYIYRSNNKTLQKMRLILGWVGIPIVFFGSIVIWYCLEHFTQVQYNLSVYFILAAASLPTFFYMIDIFNYYKLYQEKKVMYINFGGAAVNLILTLLLISSYGVLGAVIGICSSQWLMLATYKYILLTSTNKKHV